MITPTNAFRRALPDRAALFLEQLAYIGDVFARFSPLTIPVLLIYMMLIVIASMEGGRNPGIVAVLLMACVVSLLSWLTHKGAREQAYFRSLPPASLDNASLRVFAGWIVVVGSGLVLMVTLQIVGWRPGAPMWSWLTPFAGALVVFLGLSGALLISGKPGLWIHVFVWIPLLLIKFGERLFGEGSPDLLDGRFGFFTLLTGQVGTDSFRTGAADPFDLPSWLIASVIWLSISAAGLAIAASRHRDF